MPWTRLIVSKLTQQCTLEQLVGLNLVQGRFEEDTVLAQLIVVDVINGMAKLLCLSHSSANVTLGATLGASQRRPYLIVQELQISFALVLGFRGLLLGDLFLAVPVGLVLVPLVVLAVVVRGLELEVVTQSLFAVCRPGLVRC